MSDENEFSQSPASKGEVGSTVLSAHASARREKSDPETGHEPVTIGAFFLCAIALLAGGSYLGATSGSFDGDHYTVAGYTPQAPEGAGGPAVEVDPILAWRKAGKQGYATCAGCHQGSGLGTPGVYPPLVGSEFVLNGTERMAQIILNGLSGPITVKGQGFAGEMPAQKALLNDEKIAQIMSYVRYEWGNGIEEIVTKEMVTEARKRHGDHAGPQKFADLASADAMLPGGDAPAPTEAAAETAPAAP